MNTRPWGCFYHPTLFACKEVKDKWVCWSCFKAMKPVLRPAGLGPFNRAYATGLGSEAAQEAREAQRYAEDYARMMPGRTPLKEGFR